MSTDEIMDEDFIRHVLIKSLLSYRTRYPKQGKIVLCCDSGNVWRKDTFPFYKARRKNKTEATEGEGLDWNEIYRIVNMILEEFRESMPYIIVKVPRAEGDDCIAVLAKHFAPTEDIVVVSNDKDFTQLKSIPNLTIYRPLKNEEVKCADPVAFLKEMIIRGDGGDDVPNILSDDDVFMVKEKRQKSIMQKKLPAYMAGEFSDFFDADKIERNLTMIDFSRIPNDISQNIVAFYEGAAGDKTGNRQKILKYFIAKSLRYFIEKVEDF